MRILITGKNGYIAKSLLSNLDNYFDFTYPSFFISCGKILQIGLESMVILMLLFIQL